LFFFLPFTFSTSQRGDPELVDPVQWLPAQYYGRKMRSVYQKHRGVVESEVGVMMMTSVFQST
jgi:hypothetical protein